MSIAENISRVRGRIETAAVKSGRTLKDITVVAVTKGAPLEAVRQAQEAGIGVFAENRLQEAAIKVPQIPAEWHMVGHLQTNKIKDALGFFKLIQSVDSVRLAKKIQEAAAALGQIVSVLLEINISGEEQKYGFAPEEIYSAADAVIALPNLRVLGLMGIAPNSPDMEVRRASFKKLKSIFNVCKTLKAENFEMKYLSMGMSGDFEAAIEEGSNMVRLGHVIFGEPKA